MMNLIDALLIFGIILCAIFGLDAWARRRVPQWPDDPMRDGYEGEHEEQRRLG